jgi:hypothetical protein
MCINRKTVGQFKESAANGKVYCRQSIKAKKIAGTIACPGFGSAAQI